MGHAVCVLEPYPSLNLGSATSGVMCCTADLSENGLALSVYWLKCWAVVPLKKKQEKE